MRRVSSRPCNSSSASSSSSPFLSSSSYFRQQQQPSSPHPPSLYHRQQTMSKSPSFPIPPISSIPSSSSSSSSSSKVSNAFHLHNCPTLAIRQRRQLEERSHHKAATVSQLVNKSTPTKRTTIISSATIVNVRRISQENSRKPSQPQPSSLRMTDLECTGFEAQNYLKERCKKCFRLREKHEGLSALQKFPQEKSDDVLVLSTRAATTKRTQSIPTAQMMRRVPVRRSQKEEEDEDEEEKTAAAGEDGEERRKQPSAQQRMPTGTGDGKEQREKRRKRPEEGAAMPKMVKVIKVEEKKEREESAAQPDEAKVAIATKQQQEKQQQNPPKSRTTTVLLPKQRQISLGSLGGSTGGNEGNGKREKRASIPTQTTTIKPRREEEGMLCQQQQQQQNVVLNGWQFMGRDFDRGREATTNGGVRENGGNGSGRASANEDRESGDGEDDLLSLSSYQTANSRGANASHSQGGEMFSARSVDSLNSLSYAESFKTGKSPPFDEDDPFVTPTSTDLHFFIDDGGGMNGGGDFDARALTPTAASQLEFNHLRVENQRLTEQCRRYRHERWRWTEWLKRQKAKGGGGKGTNGNGNGDKDGAANGNGGPKMIVEEALTELELIVGEYREENSALKCELDRIRDRELSASAITLLNGTGGQQQQQNDLLLEERLKATEMECDQLKREREELEQELEEMQDQYRVEEIEEFRELQRELEQNAKNCRILQFKLRKSERQREQLQTEKNLLAKKYQEIVAANGGGGGREVDGKETTKSAKKDDDEEEGGGGSSQLMKRKMAELEQELRVAKEISVKLHNELEVAEERRYRLEDELFYNKEKVRELLAQNKWREAKNSREQQTRTREVLSGERGAPTEQELHREVRDSLEREADLREQLRFTEADLQRMRHRMRELELENDELLQKYTRLADQQAQQAAANGPNSLLLAVPKKPNLYRSISEGDAKPPKMHEIEISVPAAQAKLMRREEEKGTKSEETKSMAERRDSAADVEQLCFMLAAMDAQANRICKQLEKLDTIGGGGGGGGGGGSGDDKREKRRSLRGDIVPMLEELGTLLAEMKAIKEQLAKSQNISMTKSMIIGSVLGDKKQREFEEETNGEGEKEGTNSCSECEDSERKVDELRETCDFYKRKNAELTEQVIQIKDQWAEELRRAEDEAEGKIAKMQREMNGLRAEMEEKWAKAKRTEEANFGEAEMAKEKEATRKWETKCKEMKAERIKLQAEVAQLKRRTDEALQELEKMRTNHQMKEIAWIREKLKLEEQLKQQQIVKTEEMAKPGEKQQQQQKPLANGKIKEAGKAEEELRGRIVQLEKEVEGEMGRRQINLNFEQKEKLEKELAEGLGRSGKKMEEKKEEDEAEKKKQDTVKLVQIQRQPAAATSTGRPSVMLISGGGGGGEAENGGGGVGGGGRRVDYKQIADNALKAAESLQRQYREYQRQYTAEVQRLNGQLGNLETELADKEKRLREQQQQQQGMMMAQQQHQQEIMAHHQQQQQQQQAMMPMSVQIRRAVDSPSMSSLTENTTWDSRLLDCSTMTRSISPFKFPRGQGQLPPMMQCRTMDNVLHHVHHPLAIAGANEGVGMRGISVHEAVAAVGTFGSEEDVHREYRRTGSSGTNILYRIRREELSKGKNPSVRQMAKAFETFERVQQEKDGGSGGGGNGKKGGKKAKSGGGTCVKSPLFGLLGKRTSADHQSASSIMSAGQLPPSRHHHRKQSHGRESPVPSEPTMCSASATLPRGGRNPFKGMGSRIVERVRRSLSRSKKSQSRDGTPSLHTTTMTMASAGAPEEPTAIWQ